MFSCSFFFQNASACYVAAVSYGSKLFMKSTLGVGNDKFSSRSLWAMGSLWLKLLRVL
jgi:hypothetical protein